MDEKKTAELRKFLTAITDSRVRAFIDLKKLCQSGLYEHVVQMATEHAQKHGDFGFLNSIFGLVDGTVYSNAFIAHVRPKLSFIVTPTSPRRLKKATPAEVAKAVEKTLLQVATPTKKRPPKKVEKPLPRTKSEDVMDSKLLMPGGYGTGRRR
ncbi:hypothetical protein [Achromobacter xylosoxidans]|uniref:hypothetical protein n=1 Tax=Alcaligenes xylosoxydans xylosoxydans TaxID=85698 RepID=UPI001041678E|nr:hypothetical protein [Achromobacter xylosoxidans]